MKYKRGNRKPCNSEATVFLAILFVLIAYVITFLCTGCSPASPEPPPAPEPEPYLSCADTTECDSVSINMADSTISFVKLDQHGREIVTRYRIDSRAVFPPDTLYYYGCVPDTVNSSLIVYDCCFYRRRAK